MPYLIGGLVVMATVPLVSLYLVMIGLAGLANAVSRLEVEDDEE